MFQDRDFIAFLVQCGLTAAGSAETVQDLHRRHGSRSWYGFSEVIDLPGARLFPEQAAFCFHTDLTKSRYLLPPSGFACDFDAFGNGSRNHDLALARLKAIFGKPEKGLAVNTYEHSWNFGEMSLTIRTFIREDSQFGRNDLYDNNPGLWEVCCIRVERPWQPALTEADAAILRSVRQPEDVLPVTGGGLGTSFRLRGNGSGNPYFWRTATHIGWCGGAWAAIFPRADCRRLELQRVLPGRGGGFSELTLAAKNPYSLEREPAGATVLRGHAAATLDGMAGRLARFWDLPLDSSESYDC